jgi:hypothetical protein
MGVWHNNLQALVLALLNPAQQRREGRDQELFSW